MRCRVHPPGDNLPGAYDDTHSTSAQIAEQSQFCALILSLRYYEGNQIVGLVLPERDGCDIEVAAREKSMCGWLAGRGLAHWVRRSLA